MEKRLTRSRDKRVFGGVAGGLGNYLDIDPVLIRIIMVLITIFSGVGILFYIIMWIVIPEEPLKVFNPTSNENISEDFVNDDPANNFSQPIQQPSNNGRVIVGVILIAIGAVFLLEKFLPIFDFKLVFSAGLIILGIALIFNFFNKSEKPL